MSIATTPAAADRCVCGHNGLQHDVPGQVCRFRADASAPCGCVSFGYPGASSNRSPIVGNTPPLTGPNAANPQPAGANRNF